MSSMNSMNPDSTSGLAFERTRAPQDGLDADRRRRGFERRIAARLVTGWLAMALFLTTLFVFGTAYVEHSLVFFGDPRPRMEWRPTLAWSTLTGVATVAWFLLGEE